MIRRAVLAGIVAVAVPAAAQVVYRGGTDLVLLSVTVTDSAGRHVANLTREDFRIYEDGVLQEISHFSSQPLPISLSLLVDTSTSMDQDNKLGLAQLAASGFIARLGPDDVAQVLDFDSQTKILAPFTGDKAVLDLALKQMRAGGSTSLYNAIYTALSELRLARGQFGPAPRRQAIILLTDGEDTSSIVPSDDVIDLARRSEVIIYAIAIAAKSGTPTRAWNEAETVLRSLTRDTGGRVFMAPEPQQLAAIYGQVAEELANQYTVAYMSTNGKKDGTWRKISMQVLKGDAMPRTRAGYYAATGKQ
jgi:Ca-activated chloride channel family protein